MAFCLNEKSSVNNGRYLPFAAASLSYNRQALVQFHHVRYIRGTGDQLNHFLPHNKFNTPRESLPQHLLSTMLHSPFLKSTHSQDKNWLI